MVKLRGWTGFMTGVRDRDERDRRPQPYYKY
jgi:hypothetical protein